MYLRFHFQWTEPEKEAQKNKIREGNSDFLLLKLFAWLTLREEAT